MFGDASVSAKNWRIRATGTYVCCSATSRERPQPEHFTNWEGVNALRDVGSNRVDLIEKMNIYRREGQEGWSWSLESFWI